MHVAARQAQGMAFSECAWGRCEACAALLLDLSYDLRGIYMIPVSVVLLVVWWCVRVSCLANEKVVNFSLLDVL